MKIVQPKPEFAQLPEEEILKALDAYESLFEGEEGEDADLEPSDPIVEEVARLISEYTNRFETLCGEGDELPADVFEYEPATAIERVAFDVFRDALHDALQEEDDDE